MTKIKKSLILFLILAYTIPLLMVLAQSKMSDSTIGFILYGIQAAAPSISAIVVFALMLLCENRFHTDDIMET